MKLKIFKYSSLACKIIKEKWGRPYMTSRDFWQFLRPLPPSSHFLVPRIWYCYYKILEPLPPRLWRPQSNEGEKDFRTTVHELFLQKGRKERWVKNHMRVTKSMRQSFRLKLKQSHFFGSKNNFLLMFLSKKRSTRYTCKIWINHWIRQNQ